MWLFIETAVHVFTGETQAIDRYIMLMLRDPNDLSNPIGPGWFEELMRDFTALGGVGILMLISLLTVGYLLLEHKKKSALVLFIAIASGTFVSFSLKYGFTRPRPDIVPHATEVYTSSFPSGHSLMSTMVYLSLASMLSQIQSRKRSKVYLFSAAIILSVVIGISRVYLGVHWPTDVIAGWAAGLFWSLLFILVIRSMQSSGKMEKPDAE